MIKISDLLENIDMYEAHIKRNEENIIIERELLGEHIKRTEKYFCVLWEEKRVSEFLERFWKQMCGQISEEAKKFWEEMIWEIAMFHDIGKINPKFQTYAMENPKIEDDGALSRGISSRHSFVSAVLYLDYFKKQLREKVKDKKERKLLRPYGLLHSYVIARHHSDLCTFEEYSMSLEEGDGKFIIEVFAEGKMHSYIPEFSLKMTYINDLIKENKKNKETFSREQNIAIYTYEKLLYSLLVAADYYATSEFMNDVAIKDFGSLNESEAWIEIFENTDLMKKIRMYQREEYPKCSELLKKEKDINILRTEMLCDAEKGLKNAKKEQIFYLEAPTGSGKSNTAIDLSFQLMQQDKRLKKIYYIYPFNTLVEQNIQSLKKIFGKQESIFQHIAVINSLTPIKMTEWEKEKEERAETGKYYQKALLNRQFLNYPMIVSTHVTLFDTMFGDTKESAFGFHQLANSVIVLDEIQSYRNRLWGEIICFLKEFAALLNIKIIIMSATLPNLDLLAGETTSAIRLLKNSEKYFQHPRFKKRVAVSYELLEEKEIKEKLKAHIIEQFRKDKKVLVEFIKKESASEFFQELKSDEDLAGKVEYMSGEDSIPERNRILNRIKLSEDAIILVATQVIEAGVDIDMDVGYKNISKMDSEEQFLGRVNRSCLKEDAIVYFFKLDDGKRIYGKDEIRTNSEFTLENEEIREMLAQKDFCKYYEKILTVLKMNYNESSDENGMEYFFEDEVGKLNFPKVKEKMQLISEDNWSMSVYLATTLKDEEGNCIDGAELWEAYKELLSNFSMEFAEKKIKLSKVTSKMNYFIYQIKKNPDLIYNDRVGEIFYIEDGDKYFKDGKLDHKKIQGELGEFIDFI